jgi:hypothetical protein
VPALERLRSLDATELKFRLATELRKTAGRVRAAVVRPRWDRRDLAPLLRTLRGNGPEGLAREALLHSDWGLAHRQFVEHFSSRSPLFPLDPRALPKITDYVTTHFPGASNAAATRADQMLAGRYDVLGYTNVDYGTPPAWHRDPVHGRETPMAFWSRVAYLDPRFGDHKVIWEINRHQHWLAFARAYHLTRDRRYYDAVVVQLEDWLAMNPPLQGVNWASMLELGFRSLSWVWALHAFASAALEDSPETLPWTVDLLLGLDRQLTHVEQNLSTYFSPNTHLSGEALALYVSGRALPEFAASERRAAIGRDVLFRAIDHQVNDDGGHAELSPHYHRYSTDFYLLATLVARRSGDPAASTFEDAARRQASYLRAITDDNGRLPLIGDDDGGQLFPVCGRAPWDCRDTLCSAAEILDDPALAIGATPEETVWLCGSVPRDRRPTATPVSQALRASGYYVSRNASGDHLVFDAGHHGYLNGGHAHADALSVVLTTAGRPFLVDPGTATYTMAPRTRDRFRSTPMHNTVVLDRRSQSEPGGPFHWASRANASCPIWESTPRFDYSEGVHDGYLPSTHARGVLAIHGFGWIVIDHLLGPEDSPAISDVFWHIHPAWRTTRSGRLEFQHEDGLLRSIACSEDLKILDGSEAEGLDLYSAVYGRVEHGLCLRAHTTAALPRTIATFFSATAGTPAPELVRLQVTEPAGSGWHSSAFQLSWCGVDAIILSAVERKPEQVGTSAPGIVWGCESAVTDGRLAFIELSGAPAAAPIRIRGTRAEALAGVSRA